MNRRSSVQSGARLLAMIVSILCVFITAGMALAGPAPASPAPSAAQQPISLAYAMVHQGVSRFDLSGSFGLHPSNMDTIAIGEGYFITRNINLDVGYTDSQSNHLQGTTLDFAPAWFVQSRNSNWVPYIGPTVGTTHSSGEGTSTTSTAYGGRIGADFFFERYTALNIQADYARYTGGATVGSKNTTDAVIGLARYFGETDLATPSTSISLPKKGDWAIGLDGDVSVTPSDEYDFDADAGELICLNWEAGGELGYSHAAGLSLYEIGAQTRYYPCVHTPVRPYATGYVGESWTQGDGVNNSSFDFGAGPGVEYMLNADIAPFAELDWTGFTGNRAMVSNASAVNLGVRVYLTAASRH